MLDQFQRLKTAIETNNRIENAKNQIKMLEEDIKQIDGITKLLMMYSIIKQQRIDAFKSELENATPIDIDALCAEIVKIMEN